MSPRKHKRVWGFSLIEVVAALLVLGIVVAFVSARMVSIGAGAVAEADIMRANLRFAQALAMAGNTAVWSVQISAQSYQLLRDGEPSPIGWPDGSGTVRVMSPGVQVAGGAGSLVFDSMGAPPTTYMITISDDTHAETITVTGFTGLIP